MRFCEVREGENEENMSGEEEDDLEGTKIEKGVKYEDKEKKVT